MEKEPDEVFFGLLLPPCERPLMTTNRYRTLPNSGVDIGKKTKLFHSFLLLQQLQQRRPRRRRLSAASLESPCLRRPSKRLLLPLLLLLLSRSATAGSAAAAAGDERCLRGPHQIGFVNQPLSVPSRGRDGTGRKAFLQRHPRGREEGVPFL